MRYVLLLANAWSPLYAGDFWPRPSWMAALWRSPTGKTLRKMLPDVADVWVDNTTPAVGRTASEICLPDSEYVAAVLDRQRPRAVIACGKQAEEACLELWPGRLLVTPHPAWRFFSDFLAANIRETIERDEFRRLRITTASRGRIELEELGRGVA